MAAFMGSTEGSYWHLPSSTFSLLKLFQVKLHQLDHSKTTGLSWTGFMSHHFRFSFQFQVVLRALALVALASFSGHRLFIKELAQEE